MRLRYLHIPELPPLKDIDITFGHEPILGRQCTIHFLVGVNGTGKSRLLRALTEIFLSLEKLEVPPFPVTIAYDLGRAVNNQTTASQTQRTVYYHSGGGSKSRAYMVEFAYFSAYENVPWEEFADYDWRATEGGHPDYVERKRNCFAGENYSAIKAYLPKVVLAYTSGFADEWETVFSMPVRETVEIIRDSFSSIDIEQERPPYWNSRREQLYQNQESERDTSPTIQRMLARSSSSAMEQAQRALQVTSNEESIGLFIQPRTLKLVVCAVVLCQALEEFQNRPTDSHKQALIADIDKAVDEHKRMGGLRGILNNVDWLWPVTIGLRIDFRPGDFTEDQTEFIKRLYIIATEVLREAGPIEKRTLYFDLQRNLNLEDYPQQNTLQALAAVLGRGSSGAYPIFKQLLLLQQHGILEDITIALRKRKIRGLLLYDALSDGERVFLGRMALFHLLKEIDDTLIILDEPETHFNDVWKREVIDVIDNSLSDDSSEIVVATHSSIALSDVFDSEITILNKNPDDGTVYATRPVIRSFGASPDDILQEIFGAPESVGQRASEFLDMMLVLAAHPQQTQLVWGEMNGNNQSINDQLIRNSQQFRQLHNFVLEQPDAYAERSSEALADYLLTVLRYMRDYTNSRRPPASIINALDVLQERLGPGFYQFEFRRRLRALRKEETM